ncbi:hypothetical protein CEXT_182031 [Caerostris extrusa]|uniref:C2H2-type domain-containing protein n=1 Tax=Caerostris extrusa TaxID=172846 RepID=A0AAV4Y5R1_CAEEX|nr:hypothetical protein CEXT_182031 [Caerostris extrusa]
MEITKCKYCNAYVTNCEVHNCVKIGNQHRRSSATLPQCSSGNVSEDIGLITVDEMEEEALWPFLRQSNSSTLNQINQPLDQINNSRQQIIFSNMHQSNSSIQQSFLFDVHQQTDCEESSAAEMYSWYDVSTHDQYNPANSDFHFPSKPSEEENEYKSVNLQQSSEPSKILISQNSQLPDASNPWHPTNIPTSLAQQGLLPGLQQTFNQRNDLMNGMDEPHNDSSQIKYSRISLTDEVLYSTRNPIHTLNTTEQTENLPFTTLACDDPLENLLFSTLSGNSDENIFNIPETDNTNKITDPISIPGTVTVARPYKCKFCDKAYVHSSSLSKHVRTHSGDKPHQCAECGKCFADSSELRDHNTIHTVEKPYSCEECGKAFGDKSNLRRHFRIHTGEKPYNCEECGKCFASSTTLRQHISTHSGERPFACNECSKRYTRKCYLKRHMLLHAGEERSKCDSCGAEFSSEDSLEAHECRKNK